MKKIIWHDYLSFEESIDLAFKWYNNYFVPNAKANYK